MTDATSDGSHSVLLVACFGVSLSKMMFSLALPLSTSPHALSQILPLFPRSLFCVVK